MQTVNPNAGFLSNFEVWAVLEAQATARQQQLHALSDLKSKRPTRAGKDEVDREIERVQPQDLHTVTYECQRYLENEAFPVLQQTEELVTALLERLESFNLTKAERLQIINLAPRSLVELVVCVEDLEERFPDTIAQEEILALIASHLGPLKSKDERAAQRLQQVGASVYAHARAQDEAEDDDVAAAQEAAIEEDEGLIDEGTGQGILEDTGRELDEDADA
ncbi:hypothetical protein OIO90_001831 [Microbotryomycetes sp. JL221]|nr:hypothetical protein OIO90_001831 [Microbotryomycetes sp. JL221]